MVLICGKIINGDMNEKWIKKRNNFIHHSNFNNFSCIYYKCRVYDWWNSNEKKTTTTNAASSYENKILASKVFDQTPETYKVLIFSEQDVSDDLKSAITSYSGNTKLYLVNKDEAINKYVSSDTDNVKPDNSSSLKVKKEALLTISNESVTSYVTNESEIIDELK